VNSSSHEEIVEVFDALDDKVNLLCELTFDALTNRDGPRALERPERATRRLYAPEHSVINQLGAQASEEELGGTLRSALADRLRITGAEAGRRIGDAEDLGERRALTGESLAPRLTATAAAQREGAIGEEHVKVIRKFFAHLPAEIDVPTREAADPDNHDGLLERSWLHQARLRRPGVPQPGPPRDRMDHHGPHRHRRPRAGMWPR
jgi:hypothetical protein